jgi:hypothetical protein
MSARWSNRWTRSSVVPDVRWITWYATSLSTYTRLDLFVPIWSFTENDLYSPSPVMSCVTNSNFPLHVNHTLTDSRQVVPDTTDRGGERWYCYPTRYHQIKHRSIPSMSLKHGGNHFWLDYRKRHYLSCPRNFCSFVVTGVHIPVRGPIMEDIHCPTYRP